MTRSRRGAPARRPAQGATRARALTGVVVAVAFAVSLAGCTAVDRLVSPGTEATGGPPTPAASEPAAAPPAPAVPSVDAVRATGITAEVDGTAVVHLLATGAPPRITLETDGDETVVTLDPGDPAAPVDVLLAAPAGASLVPQDDASVLVLTGDGGFLGGVGRPLMGPGAAPARVAAEPDGAVHLRGTGPFTTRVGADALVSTDWGEREGGRSLAVEPSSWARTAGLAGELGTWTELVRAVPEADTQTMRDQLTCHALGAPDKPTWNLEPWRPDVGLLLTMAASCNAT